MMISIPAVIAGACIGAGVTVMVAGCRPVAPDVGVALDIPSTRALPPARSRRRTPVIEPAHGPIQRCTVQLADRLTGARGDTQAWPVVKLLRLDRRAGDLALLDETLDVLLVRTAACALGGLLLPPLLAGLALLGGVRLGLGTPMAAALLTGCLLAAVPSVHVRARAAHARQELRRAVCAFLDLVALERAADAGPVEAVERAAAISDTAPFVRIRRALTGAQLDGRAPWHGLRDLAETTGVVELGDLADILASSGRDGAAVCTSLRARAATLRTALTATDTAAANTRSEYMVIPVAALGLVFMALLAYPAMVRLVLGT
jgi:hypothetical protein